MTLSGFDDSDDKCFKSRFHTIIRADMADHPIQLPTRQLSGPLTRQAPARGVQRFSSVTLPDCFDDPHHHSSSSINALDLATDDEKPFDDYYSSLFQHHSNNNDPSILIVPSRKSSFSSRSRSRFSTTLHSLVEDDQPMQAPGRKLSISTTTGAAASISVATDTSLSAPSRMSSLYARYYQFEIEDDDDDDDNDDKSSYLQQFISTFQQEEGIPSFEEQEQEQEPDFNRTTRLPYCLSRTRSLDSILGFPIQPPPNSDLQVLQTPERKVSFQWSCKGSNHHAHDPVVREAIRGTSTTTSTKYDSRTGALLPNRCPDIPLARPERKLSNLTLTGTPLPLSKTTIADNY